MNQPLDKLFQVVKLEIVFFQERLFAVQIFFEVGVIVLIGLVQRVADFGIPGLHMPAIAIVILIGSHIALEAPIPVGLAAVFLRRRQQPLVGDEAFQNVVAAHHQRAGGVHGVQMEVGIDGRDLQLPHLVDAHLMVVVDNETLHDGQLLPIFGEEHIVWADADEI